MVLCGECHYAANLDKAVSRGPAIPTHTATSGAAEAGPLEKFPTPGVLTIEDLARAPHNVAPERQIKTLVYLVESKLALILLRGDDQLNEAKWTGVLGTANFRPASAEEIFAGLGAHPGSLGAVRTNGIPVYADTLLRDATQMTTGANEDGFHCRNVAINRDIAVLHWVDLRLARAEEACITCGRPLKIERAIEVGHVFKLGTKYSEKLDALFLDEAGARRPAVMGCYGIGVSRTLQAVIEQGNDKDGIIWPLSVAPYQVCITPLSVAPESAVMALAEKIYSELTQRGVEVS